MVKNGLSSMESTLKWVTAKQQYYRYLESNNGLELGPDEWEYDAASREEDAHGTVGREM